MITITKAYIQEYGNGKMEPEHLGVKSILESRGVDCELFTSKILRRDQLLLTDSTLVVGDHPTMETVFRKIGYNNSGDSYPKSLRSYLKRRVWESTIGDLLRESQSKELSEVFIKPKNRAKLFTGFIVNSNQDLYRLDGISKQSKIYCSSLVDWLSEYRVFVNNSKIVGVRHYQGDSRLQLNINEVENAIADFEKSAENTVSYGIDFGVLMNGETALVEWNDGFALGSYELDQEIYTDLILARWQQILEN
jgi:hypothetical protein